MSVHKNIILGVNRWQLTKRNRNAAKERGLIVACQKNENVLDTDVGLSDPYIDVIVQDQNCMASDNTGANIRCMSDTLAGKLGFGSTLRRWRFIRFA